MIFWMSLKSHHLFNFFTSYMPLLQAVEKLLLAEGTKIAMTKVQSAYDQGVYGLVVNLGSIAARLLFQPFEEAAFMSFSQPVAEEGRVEQQLRKLMPLVRVALLFGAFLLKPVLAEILAH